MEWIDAEQLAEQQCRVAGAPLGVTTRPAVAHRHVQHPVRTELQIAAVVVRVRLIDLQQHTLGADIERPIGGDRVFGDHRVALVVGVVEPCQRAVARERDPEQAALALGPGPVRQVGHVLDRRAAVGVDGDAEHGAILADDVERSVAGAHRQPHRAPRPRRPAAERRRGCRTRVVPQSVRGWARRRSRLVR